MVGQRSSGFHMQKYSTLKVVLARNNFQAPSLRYCGGPIGSGPLRDVDGGRSGTEGVRPNGVKVVEGVVWADRGVNDAFWSRRKDVDVDVERDNAGGRSLGRVNCS